MKENPGEAVRDVNGEYQAGSLSRTLRIQRQPGSGLVSGAKRASPQFPGTSRAPEKFHSYHHARHEVDTVIIPLL